MKWLIASLFIPALLCQEAPVVRLGDPCTTRVIAGVPEPERVRLRDLYPPDPPPTPKMHYVWLASLVAMDAMQAADVASSIGGYEGNPLIGQGRFNAGRAALIKAPIVAGVNLLQIYMHRRYHHAADKQMSVVNWMVSTLYVGVVAHNERVK